jgi:SNW domain-containing protein 1
MATLFNSLPAPQHSYEVYNDPSASDFAQIQKPEPPPYGQRKGFIPRANEDFGDGGAFPEIHVAQYPLDMGKPNKKPVGSTAIVSVNVDAEGNIKHDAIVQKGTAQKVYSSFTDLVQKDFKKDSLVLPTKEEEEEATLKTQKALGLLIDGKIAAARPVQCAKGNVKDPTFIRYTPDTSAPGFNTNARQRVIRMVEAQVDPMEPPKFKHRKVARGPPSPPVPVMHSPPRKVTVQDQQAWKIPPCVSNWKNARGYTIPLDKRLAADGRGLQEVAINDNFAAFSESLYIAERKAREEVKYRATVQKKLSQKDKARKEDELRDLATRARMERAGIHPTERDTGGGGGGGGGGRDRESHDADDDDDEAEPARQNETREEAQARRQRDQMRAERKRDREREMRLENLTKKKSKYTRDADRDIGEKMALGMQTGGGKLEGEAQFDSRLFNQSQGMDSGFGREDDYNTYSKALFDKGERKIYAAGRGGDAQDALGDAESQYKELKSTSKFRPEKDFRGVDRDAPSSRGNNPVQFEREEQEVDPFGLDQFLTDAKKGKKMDSIGSGGTMKASAGARSSEDYASGGSRNKVDFRSGK